MRAAPRAGTVDEVVGWAEFTSPTNENCACAQPPSPGQLTKPSRLRDAPSRRVAEPNCQTATSLSLRGRDRGESKTTGPSTTQYAREGQMGYLNGAEFVATPSAMALSAIKHRAECWMPAAGYPLGAREAHASHCV